MANKIFYKLRRDDGKYWSYGATFTDRGKEFHSKDALIHALKITPNKPKYSMDITEVEYSVTSSTNMSLLESLKIHNSKRYLFSNYGTFLSEFWFNNNCSFGDFTHYLNAVNSDRTDKQIYDLFKGNGYGRNDFKKDGNNFLLKNVDLVVIASVSLKQSGSKQLLVNLKEVAGKQIADVNKASEAEYNKWQ